MMLQTRNPQNIVRAAGTILLFALIILLGGCGSAPDTSAPERTVVDRSADWHGALLYIADAQGPDTDSGSVRIYDNVSGFVENTVEQTQAAAPSDMLVTPDGGSMYVASSYNGKIEKFHWDGSNWIHGPVIETPAQGLLAIDRGPDGFLYAAAEPGPGGSAGVFYRLDPAGDTLAGAPVTFPALAAVHGISWSPDGTTAYVSGMDTAGRATLLTVAWPTGEVKGSALLPDVTSVNKALTSPDGRFVYVMCRGGILKVDAAAKTIAAALTPALASPEIDYYGADFSADGRYLFTTGTPPGGPDSTLYIIDLTNNTVVQTVKHISIKAGGIQRTE